MGEAGRRTAGSESVKKKQQVPFRQPPRLPASPCAVSSFFVMSPHKALSCSSSNFPLLLLTHPRHKQGSCTPPPSPFFRYALRTALPPFSLPYGQSRSSGPWLSSGEEGVGCCGGAGGSISIRALDGRRTTTPLEPFRSGGAPAPPLLDVTDDSACCADCSSRRSFRFRACSRGSEGQGPQVRRTPLKRDVWGWGA